MSGAALPYLKGHVGRWWPANRAARAPSLFVGLYGCRLRRPVRFCEAGGMAFGDAMRRPRSDLDGAAMLSAGSLLVGFRLALSSALFALFVMCDVMWN